ncbi:MAG: response regulator transcription factor [Candidatus Omnitrophota bacterium]
MSISVLLVDDHSIVRQGIRWVIGGEKDMEIVGEAADGMEAVAMAKDKNPDIVIMDISLPLLNGLDATQKIMKENKNIKVLILSMHENRSFIEKALSCGARGYVLKDNASDEIVKAIREVEAGRYFLSQKLSSFVIHDYALRKQKGIRLRSASVLTDREREVLQLIAEGMTNKEIAQKLELSIKTVLVHRNNIMQKLDIHNQTQLIKFALKEGIVHL